LPPMNASCAIAVRAICGGIEADTNDVDHILAPTRPFRRVELQVCLLSGSNVDRYGLVGIKCQAGGANDVMLGCNLAVETPPSCSYPTLTPYVTASTWG
jgi:hypothetical protein